MTRCFADVETGIVGPDVVEYYRKRAGEMVSSLLLQREQSSVHEEKGIQECQVCIPQNKFRHGKK